MMNSSQRTPRWTTDGMYTITQAAQILSTDRKTLAKRIKASGIEPLVPPDDRRERLLSEGQLEELRGTLDVVGKTPRAALVAGSMSRLYKQLFHRVTKVEERVTKSEQDLGQIARQLNELTRVFVGVVADMAEVASQVGARQATEVQRSWVSDAPEVTAMSKGIARPTDVIQLREEMDGRIEEFDRMLSWLQSAVVTLGHDIKDFTGVDLDAYNNASTTAKADANDAKKEGLDLDSPEERRETIERLASGQQAK